MTRCNRLIGLVFFALGCSTPALDDVAWRCTRESDCGDGYVCQVSAGFCRTTDEAGRNGVESDRILLGALLPSTRGPVSAGQAWLSGLNAALERVNRAGGVHGRRLELAARDDGYDPETALSAFNQLTGRRQVLAVLGGFGDHVAEVVAGAAQESGVLYFARAGLPALRNATDRHLFALTPGEAAEGKWLVEQLNASGVPSRNIAVLAQATLNGQAPDAQGEAVLLGLQLAGVEAPGLGLVPPGSVDVEAAVDDLLSWLLDANRQANADGRVQTALVLGTEAAAAGALVPALLTALHDLQTGRTTHPDISPAELAALDLPRLVATSAGGAGELARALAAATPPPPELGSGWCDPGILVALGVPSWQSNDGLATDFRNDLNALDPTAEVDDLAFEGYLTGRLLAAALETQGREIAAEVLVDTLAATTLPTLGFRDGRQHAITTVTGLTVGPGCQLLLP